MIGRLNAKKAENEARLADAALYVPAAKAQLDALVLDQAYVARELAQLEGEWLERQAELEQRSA
jgi:ATP-binding cassette subfamily F protein 3